MGLIDQSGQKPELVSLFLVPDLVDRIIFVYQIYSVFFFPHPILNVMIRFYGPVICYLGALYASNGVGPIFKNRGALDQNSQNP